MTRATTKKPAAEKPATKKPATKKPATKKPATKKPATKKPTTKKPAAKAAPRGPAAALLGEVETIAFDQLTRGALRTFPKLFGKLVRGTRGAIDELAELLESPGRGARPAAALAAPLLIDALALPELDRPALIALIAQLTVAQPARWLGKPLDEASLWFGQRNTRRAVAERLITSRAGTTMPHGAALLADPEPAVRAAALGLIAWLAPAALGPLVDAVRARRADPDPAVRGPALVALGHLGASTAELTAGLDDPAPAVQVCAAVALGRRLGGDLSERAVAALEAGTTTPELAGFPWYRGEPAALARAQYLALDPVFRPRVLASVAALLDGDAPWPVAEALLRLAFPTKVRARWTEPLPVLDDLQRAILTLVVERPALLDERGFAMVATQVTIPRTEIPLRAWAGLPRIPPRWFPVRRMLTLGDRTAELAVWIMEHADGAVADSDTLARAIAEALDDEDLARTALAWELETEPTGGTARRRPIEVPLIVSDELPSSDEARATVLAAARQRQLAALVEAGWEPADADQDPRQPTITVWRGYQVATVGPNHASANRVPYAGSARWSVLRALARLGAARPGFLAAATRLDPGGDRAVTLSLWAREATGALPPLEVDAAAVRFQATRWFPMTPIPSYLRTLPPDRRERVVLEMLGSATNNRRDLITLVTECRTARTIERAVEVFASGLTWGGQGLDDSEADALARSAGPGAVPHLERLATTQAHPRIALAIARCRAAP